jgi:hypothetical protein
MTPGKHHLNKYRRRRLQRIQPVRRLLWEVIAMRRVSVLAVAAAVLLVACGNESETAQTGGTPTMTPTGSSSSSPRPETPSDDLVNQAKADLTKQVGIDAAEIVVVSSEEVTWPDGSLGCPKPGMRYTQALVPGHRTILEAGGKRYHYHSGGHRAPFLCEHPQPPIGR